MTYKFMSRPPGVDLRLGSEYWPGLTGAPTMEQAFLWGLGAKAALAYAADLIRTAQASGKSTDEILNRIDDSTAVPTTRMQDGHEFQTAVLVERSGKGDAWWAWSLHCAGQPLPEGFHAEGSEP